MPNPHKPRDEEERELMDPESWDWDSTTEGRTIGTPGAILRVRFTRDEIRELSRLARQEGVGPVEYTRLTMLRHLFGYAGKEEETPQRQPA